MIDHTELDQRARLEMLVGHLADLLTLSRDLVAALLTLSRDLMPALQARHDTANTRADLACLAESIGLMRAKLDAVRDEIALMPPPTAPEALKAAYRVMASQGNIADAITMARALVGRGSMAAGGKSQLADTEPRKSTPGAHNE